MGLGGCLLMRVGMLASEQAHRLANYYGLHGEPLTAGGIHSVNTAGQYTYNLGMVLAQPINHAASWLLMLIR
jgi:hypothetical protein